MPHRHHRVVSREDGVRVEMALDAAERIAQGTRSAEPRSLVELHDTAAAMVVRLPPVLEQHVERGRGNSALLHAHAGVAGEWGEHRRASDRSGVGGKSWSHLKGLEAHRVSHRGELRLGFPRLHDESPPMNRTLRNIVASLAATAALAVFADDYPTRPITMVVPFSAGGPTDTIARIFAARLGTSLGQTVVVENTTGAAGTIGTGKVVRAAPDGYTVLIGHWSTHVVNGAIYPLP